MFTHPQPSDTEKPADEKQKAGEDEKSLASVVEPQVDEVAIPSSVVQTEKPAAQVVINSTTGEVITEASSPAITTPGSRTLQMQADTWGLRRNHSEDILRLAAINVAFREGLIALEALNLDDDLYWRAVEDLRRKYYSQRNLIMNPKQN
jgi:hypothetical protein